MATTHPATITRNVETETDHPPVKDLTFLLGPPSDREAVDRIAEAAAKAYITPEEQWIEMVRGMVNELLEPDVEGRSTLDAIVSLAVDQRVTVWGVSGALHVQCGRQVPGLTIDMAQVLDLAGRPVDHDFADPQIRGRIARALMQYTNADWAVCTAFYQADELGFPNLGCSEKDA